MNRRDFFRSSALIAAGAVAADQIEIVERLGWKRRIFPGWSTPESLHVRFTGETRFRYVRYAQLLDKEGRVISSGYEAAPGVHGPFVPLITAAVA